MWVTVLVAAAVAPLVVLYLLACLRDPLRFALPPYLVAMPFSSVLAVGSGPFSSLSSLLGFVLGASLVAQLVTTRPLSRRLPVVVPVWLAFLALCGLSFFWSVAPGATLDGFLTLSSLVLLFVALVLSGFDQRSLRRFENAVVLGGILTVCYGLVQMLFLGGLPTRAGGVARFGDDLLGANNQAAALLLPIALTAWRTMNGPPKTRMLHGAATLLLVFGVLMTGSRGGLLATLVVLSTVVVLSSARLATKLQLAGVVAVTLAVVLLIRPGGVGARQLQGIDTSGRSDIWAVAVEACPRHCLTGAGWGSFPTVYRLTLPSASEARVQERHAAFEPHNIFILAGIEAGLLGLLLLGAGLVFALRSALRLPRVLRGPPVAALLGTIVSSFFLSNLEFKFFWVVLTYAAIAGTVAVVQEDAVSEQAVMSGRDLT